MNLDWKERDGCHDEYAHITIAGETLTIELQEHTTHYTNSAWRIMLMNGHSARTIRSGLKTIHAAKREADTIITALKWYAREKEAP